MWTALATTAMSGSGGSGGSAQAPGGATGNTSGSGSVSVGSFSVPAYSKGFSLDLSNTSHMLIAAGVTLLVGVVVWKYAHS